MLTSLPPQTPTLRGPNFTLAGLVAGASDLNELLAEGEFGVELGDALEWPGALRWAVYDNAAGAMVGVAVLGEWDAPRGTATLRLAWGEAAQGWVAAAAVAAQVCDLALVEFGAARVLTTTPVDSPRVGQTLREVGFVPGRQFAGARGQRRQRWALTRPDRVRAIAEGLIARHLDTGWSFDFDWAKRRAGLCNYTERRISLSRHFVASHNLEQATQVILHEIAHALAGSAAGHGAQWKAVAKSLGYRFEKIDGNLIAQNTASWVGLCPAGHPHYRFREPTRKASCAKCSPGFSRANLIEWRKRDPNDDQDRD